VVSLSRDPGRIVAAVPDPLDVPIARQKTYELVEERLLALISGGRLQPGDAMPAERELAQLYSVGRSSIREALRMLESKGVIRSSGNGSFSVAEFGNALDHSLSFLVSVDQADVNELFEIRRTVEGEAAALAAVRHVEADAARMAHEIEAMAAARASEQGFITADMRFHIALAQASRNRLLVHLTQAIRAQVQQALLACFHVEGLPEHAIETHRVILDAVTRREPEEARRRMHEHVARVQEAAASVRAA
jgi:GntR family transcriptional regulator, transcriptional repressor for pyruvate dehydrogenase complex